MKNLFVVTHTQSIHHVEGKVGGWYDTGLTEKGRDDAAKTADRLLDWIAHQNVEIYSSDLQRAMQTAAVIGDRFGQPVAATAALREISYGVAEGQPQAWLDERYVPAPDNDRLDHRGGIEGGETRREVAERIYAWLDPVLQRDCDTQIIVTHGFALTLVICAWMKLPINGCGFASFPAKGGSITHLKQDDFFRSRAVLRLADTSHLLPQ
ncbi:histidine phosphatase family protein [Rhizobium sp. RU36D]|uniref:histidine phosphatase family protein n=1 Tax=Rhizobium sp. RU36D TaxID=1907415 RepID=UPI0009D810B5|nr:histidine phosphatase family protein [Rhizobium sp. RU36D]SMC96913.1 probable phosphoglycerate mutase [Rhizobium sp. RU36D]